MRVEIARHVPSRVRSIIAAIAAALLCMDIANPALAQQPAPAPPAPPPTPAPETPPAPPAAVNVPLRGVVTDAKERAPRPGAIVSIYSLGATALTDEKGVYTLSVPPGTYVVQVELAGYAPLEKTVTVGPDPASVDFQLAEGKLSEETIVVTGTSRARTAFDTPLAVQTREAHDLARLGTSSQADILASIPTIKAEAGGGEVASNVFIRGLPSGGQYQFTPLMYDGIPVLSSFGLNSSAYDVYYRNDLGMERLEFVRGGVSNLFGPGSVAGLINYISRTGGEETTGTAQLEWADRFRSRGDVAVSGPLGKNLFYALSGYYRTDDGPIRTGDLDNEGFQVRGNLRKRFSDGSGHVTLYGQYIDDQAQFYLPIPLEGDTRNRARGNDGRRVSSVQNDHVGDLGFATPDGPFTTKIENGVLTQGGSIGLALEKKLGGGWGINGRAHYARYGHRFGLWSDGDGVVNVPETLESFLTNPERRKVIPELAEITPANASFTFADDGSAVPAEYLLFPNRFIDRDRPMHDFTAELNLTKEFKTGPARHTVTLGGFYGGAVARDSTVTTTYLAEFNNQPRLVNLVVTNPTTGAQTVISQGGLLNAGTGYANNRHQAKRYPFYIADQIEAGRFAFDIGFRLEHLQGDLRRERTATVVTDETTPNLSNVLRDVVWGDDTFQTADVSATAWALAAGALYRLTDKINIYTNASRGYFFPELRAITISATGEPASYEGEIIKQAEMGVKYNTRALKASLAGLYTRLSNRRQVNFINDPNNPGGFLEQVNIVGTGSYGIEATLRLRLVEHLFFEGNLTLQDHKYKAFDTAPDNVGNELERQPNILYNAGLFYYDRRLDASVFTNYTGDNFTAANNAIELEGFNIVNLDAGYRIPIDGNSVRVGVNVFNVFDTDATTEGSPRQDVNQTTGGAYFVGRPVLPRRITARVAFNF